MLLRSHERLELPKILARLAGHCACALGRARVEELVPARENALARTRLAETSEAVSFVETVRFPPFGGLDDVYSSLKAASIGAVLEAPQLLALGRFAEGARRLREVIWGANAEQFPILRALATEIEPRPDVEKAISEAIDDNGEIRDDASLDLLRARRTIRSTQSQIQTRLKQMLGESHVTPHLQDAFVTVRDGRYCLPVKAESRGSVPGIVHDRSSSGGTIFVEPQAVVEMNNRLRELAGEERAAMLEILKALSGHVGGAFEELSAAQEAAGKLDFAFAKANLSLQMKAREVVLRDEVAGYCLKAARHPLVEGCVANDIFLGDESEIVPERGDFDVMMLTGPNTGGKTVVLKTLGLLTAMTACGLHIPVEEKSWLSLPKAIWVDIGDEQSIEQSLSTFSSHLKNIVQILQNVQPNDLVLFDEIGAGTDPDEGAALAKAVLRNLSRRGAKVVATTHYGELKQFALSAGRFENASVEFDPQSLRPTFHLRIGVPGASNALDIAARLGMPPDLVSRARKYLGRERVDAEAAAQQLEATSRELQSQTEDARREREEIEKLRLDYERRLEKIEAEKEREIAAARREARNLVETAQKEADEALQQLRRAARQGGSGENRETEAARARLRTLRERVAASPKDEGKGTKDEKPKADVPSLSTFRPHPLSLREGSAVRIKSLGDREGEIVRLFDGKAEVRVGAMKVEVKTSDLELVASATGQKVRGVAAIQARKAWSVADELQLIGKTTDEAIYELEKYLDDAILAEKESVRIVHGRGSGALRSAIHRFLKGQRAVVEFELAPQNEGGDGATVVKLKG